MFNALRWNCERNRFECFTFHLSGINCHNVCGWKHRKNMIKLTADEIVELECMQHAAIGCSETRVCVITRVWTSSSVVLIMYIRRKFIAQRLLCWSIIRTEVAGNSSELFAAEAGSWKCQLLCMVFDYLLIGRLRKQTNLCGCDCCVSFSVSCFLFLLFWVCVFKCRPVREPQLWILCCCCY